MPPRPRHVAPRSHSAGWRRRRTIRAWLLPVVLVLTVALALPASPAAAVPGDRIYVGAVGDVERLSRHAGARLAVHAYGHFAGRVPEGRMLTVRADARWREVAAVRTGSRLHADIVRWARTVASRPGPVFLAYHHEPEASGSRRYGTSREFVAAYRRVVSIFRAEGARNVRFTWQMTDWAFRASPRDQAHAARWYPGDAYVDVVGPDVYNWFDCGHGRGRWMPLSSLAEPALDFARARGKQVALPEFGADPDPRRARWLADGHDYLVANRDVVAAVFYFNHPPTNPRNRDCSWPLTTAAEHHAYGHMARDSRYFTS